MRHRSDRGFSGQPFFRLRDDEHHWQHPSHHIPGVDTDPFARPHVGTSALQQISVGLQLQAAAQAAAAEAALATARLQQMSNPYAKLLGSRASLSGSSLPLGLGYNELLAAKLAQFNDPVLAAKLAQINDPMLATAAKLNDPLIMAKLEAAKLAQANDPLLAAKMAQANDPLLMAKLAQLNDPLLAAKLQHANEQLLAAKLTAGDPRLTAAQANSLLSLLPNKLVPPALLTGTSHSRAENQFTSNQENPNVATTPTSLQANMNDNKSNIMNTRFKDTGAGDIYGNSVDFDRAFKQNQEARTQNADFFFEREKTDEKGDGNTPLFCSTKWAPPDGKSDLPASQDEQTGGGWETPILEELVLQPAGSLPTMAHDFASMDSPPMAGSEGLPVAELNGRKIAEDVLNEHKESGGKALEISGLLESLRQLEKDENGWSEEHKYGSDDNIWGKPDPKPIAIEKKKKISEDENQNVELPWPLNTSAAQYNREDMDSILEEIRLRQRKSTKARIPPPLSLLSDNTENVSLMDISAAPSRDSNTSTQDQQSVSQMSVCLDDNIIINPDNRQQMPNSRCNLIIPNSGSEAKKTLS